VGIFPVAVVIVFKGILGPQGVKVVPLSPREKRTDKRLQGCSFII
jgi:hypothetical protein